MNFVVCYNIVSFYNTTFVAILMNYCSCCTFKTDNPLRATQWATVNTRIKMSATNFWWVFKCPNLSLNYARLNKL